MTLLEWLEDFCDQLDNSENPFSYDVYMSGFNAGCHDTQRKIVKKLRYAIEVEKSRNNLENGL